jgi:hypothetical protein
MKAMMSRRFKTAWVETQWEGSANKIIPQKNYFIGKEVELSPAHGLKTLFVKTETSMDAPTILATANIKACDHIYLGAGQSFMTNTLYGSRYVPVSETDNHGKTLQILQGDSLKFENFDSFPMGIHWLLETTNYWVTLDFDVMYLDLITSWNLFKYEKFIPMISVKLPSLHSLNKHAIIKLDDNINFNGATNNGVWCHNLQSLAKRKGLTKWAEYVDDKETSPITDKNLEKEYKEYSKQFKADKTGKYIVWE